MVVSEMNMPPFGMKQRSWIMPLDLSRSKLPIREKGGNADREPFAWRS